MRCSLLAEGTSEAPAGFESLFNGKDLDRLEGQGGVLVGPGRGDHRRDEGEVRRPQHLPRLARRRAGQLRAALQVQDHRRQLRRAVPLQGDQRRSHAVSAATRATSRPARSTPASSTTSSVAGKRGIMAERGTKVTWTKDNKQKVEKLPMTLRRAPEDDQERGLERVHRSSPTATTSFTRSTATRP